jgi:hypothetical protein
MESPRHWYSIAGELLVKSCEGILEARIRPELRKFCSVDYNVVLQTIVTEVQDLRERIGLIDLENDWSMSLCLHLKGVLVECWSLHYASR